MIEKKNGFIYAVFTASSSFSFQHFLLRSWIAWEKMGGKRGICFFFFDISLKIMGRRLTGFETLALSPFFSFPGDDKTWLVSVSIFRILSTCLFAFADRGLAGCGYVARHSLSPRFTPHFWRVDRTHLFHARLVRFVTNVCSHPHRVAASFPSIAANVAHQQDR